MCRTARATPTSRKMLGPEGLWSNRIYQHVSIWQEPSEKTTAEDFISNNLARAIGIDVCTSIKKFRGSLKAVKNNHGLAKGIQIHDIFFDLPGQSKALS